jgi:hypothetical protein
MDHRADAQRLGGLSVHDGANYEGLARMLFGDDAIDGVKPGRSRPMP